MAGRPPARCEYLRHEGGVCCDAVYCWHFKSSSISYHISHLSLPPRTQHKSTRCTIPTPRCDDLDKLKAFIPSLRDEIKGDRAFKEFYLFCYGFSKVKGQRSLDKETAIAMFGLLLEVRSSLPVNYAIRGGNTYIHTRPSCARLVVGFVVWEWGLFKQSCTSGMYMHYHVHVRGYFYRTD